MRQSPLVIDEGLTYSVRSEREFGAAEWKEVAGLFPLGETVKGL